MANDDFIQQFISLHEKARKAPLSGAERLDYDRVKERFAGAICASQRILVRPGQQARAHFRVAVVYKVQLTIAEKPASTVTMDLSMGGFSAIVAPTPAIGSTGLPFEMSIPKIDPIKGKVDVVGIQGPRASFRFTEMHPDHVARLETALFDAILSQFKR